MWSLSHLRSMFIDRVMHFWKILGDEVKGRSPKKLRSLIDLCGEPESTGSKFQCDLISSPYCVPVPSYPSWGKFWISGKDCVYTCFWWRWEHTNRNVKQTFCFIKLVSKEFTYHDLIAQLRMSLQSYPFRGKFGDQVQDRWPKKLISLIRVPYVVHLKVQVLSFNIILVSSPGVLLDRAIHFVENLGDKVKDRSQKKLKLIMEVPYVAHLKVQVLIYNVILISSTWRVPRPSYPFREIFGVQVKGRSLKSKNWW